MFDYISCCKGFKEATRRNKHGTLRVSAKYTDFDINPYKIVVSPNKTGARPGKKAALVKAFIQLGQECGTHFTSLYPQWGVFKEDEQPWKHSKTKGKNKTVRKIGPNQLKFNSTVTNSNFNDIFGKNMNITYRDLYGGVPKNKSHVK